MNALSALFQKRIDGDDALLRLAARRFAQAGLAAEIYAGSAEELEHGLTLAPAEPCLPMVHLDRRMDVLNPAHRRMIRNLAARFRGRVRGFVVHDNARMSDHTADLVSVLRTFDHDDLGFLPPDQPCLFLE
jgi:hypothetical protein